MRCRVCLATVLVFLLAGLTLGRTTGGTPVPPAEPAGYPFQQPPGEAVKKLARVKDLPGPPLVPHADDLALFRDTTKGRFRTWKLEEAALLASGVTDRARRKDYLTRIDKLFARARKATSGARSPREKGERLLSWLHAGPLAKGYSSGQTSLAVLLDGGPFNCVSSAVLYNILAIRLGLDARAVQVPNHVFSILLLAGKTIDVETTSAAGFDPDRDPERRKKVEKITGQKRPTPRSAKERRLVREAGLVALIYYNRGVLATQEKRHGEALLCYLCALNLDRDFGPSSRNILATLTNWPAELGQQKKFRAGMRLVAFGLDLAPGHETLVHNRKVFYSQWAQALAEVDKPDAALKVLRHAARIAPADASYFETQEPQVFLTRAEALARAGKWEEARKVCEPGLEKLTGKAREGLVRWRQDLTLRQAAALADRGEPMRACTLLAAALKTDPKDSRLANNLCYTVQEWARKTLEKEGEEKARAVLHQALTRFGQVPGLRRVAIAHSHRVTLGHVEKQRWQEALATADRHADLLGDTEAQRRKGHAELSRLVYDRWAKSFMAQKKWDDAIRIYERALEQFPEDEVLKNNLAYCQQEKRRAVAS